MTVRVWGNGLSVKSAISNERKAEQGFILVMVLVLIAFMTLALGTFSVWVNKELEHTKALTQKSEGELAFFSLKQNFLYFMSRASFSPRGLEFNPVDPKKPPEDNDDEMSYLPLFDKVFGDQKLRISLQDEGGLINLESLDNYQRNQLFDLFEVDASERDGLVAKLKDYVSKNPTGTGKSLGGASVDDYEDANLPGPTFKPLRTPYEIKRVLGWRDHEPFFKDNALPKMLSTVPKEKINLNTVPEKNMAFIQGMTPEIQSFLLEKRASDTPYIQHAREISQSTGQKFSSDFGVGTFPSKTIRATLSSKEFKLNTQLSVSQTLYDQKTPWRINYEVSAESDSQRGEEQPEITQQNESTGPQLILFPDPATVFSQDKGNN